MCGILTWAGEMESPLLIITYIDYFSWASVYETLPRVIAALGLQGNAGYMNYVIKFVWNG